MNYLAENCVTITKDLFLEGMLRMSRDSYGKFARKCVFLLAAIWVAMLYFTVKSGGSLMHLFTCLLVVILLGVWISVLIPRNHAKKAWRTQQNIYGDSMKRITRFYDDHLEISGDCAERSVSYGDIQDIRLSRNLIMLVSRDKMGILLAREGFTAGDFEIVADLIRNAPR